MRSRKIQENMKFLMQGSTPRTQITECLLQQRTFASARDTGGVAKKVFKWNNESLPICTVQISSDGSMDKPEVFNKTSTVGFMSLHLFYQRWPNHVFTRNNYLNGKSKRQQTYNIT
jgi:hypothetical protein